MDFFGKGRKMLNFGERFRMCRKQAGLKQVAAAKLMGIGQSTISEYENNKTEPTASMLLKMAQAYGVTVDYLLGTKWGEE